MTAAHHSFEREPSPTPVATLITAGPGFGKSSLLTSLRPADGTVVSATDLVLGGVPEGVSWIGVDDFDRLSDLDRARALHLLTDRPGLGVAIASRSPLPAVVRHGLRARMSVRDAGDLALTPYAVARLLTDRFGVADPEAALRVTDLTGGWPTLVQLAGDVLERDPQADLAAVLAAPGAPAADWIRAGVLDPLPVQVRELLGTLAWIDVTCPHTQRVCAAVLGDIEPTIVAGLPETLRQAGLLVRRRRTGQLYELVPVPLVALVARTASPPPALPVVAAIGHAYEADRMWLPAARAYVAAGDRANAVRLLRDRCDELLRRGDAPAFVELVDATAGPPDDQSETLRGGYADALRMAGDTSRARRAFGALLDTPPTAPRDLGLLVRFANLHYLCGDFQAALSTLDRVGERDARDCPDTVEIVDWLACRGHVLVMMGRTNEARPIVDRCLDVAERLGDDRSLGVAHLVAARTSRGARMDLHLEEALRYATAADDAVTATRALQTQTSVLLAAARYGRVCELAREAARMARLCCPPGLQAAALHNLGEALARVGEFDEALWHLQCSVAVCRRLGPARAALGLVGIADIHQTVGRSEQARAAYTEAAELASGSGDVQVQVAALCGQARLAADDATLEAEAAVGEALRLADDDTRPLALTTAGRLASVRGNRSEALGYARRAVAAARNERDAELVANALELEAATVEDPARAREALREAWSIWSDGGARPAVARTEVLIGQLPDADSTERSRARDAERDLRRLGLPVAGLGGGAHGRFAGTIVVAVLGPFTVRVHGAEVPLPAWRSRQARTLVKILAAHRGRVVTRDRLCELLWPDDDPARTGHRLSVLLATVRGVLDPEKAWSPDRYIAADQFGLRLQLGAVVLDAEMLLRDATHASELLDRGEIARAREVLSHIDALFRGEACEDESADWADGLREEVRAAWSRSMRRLANLQMREGRGPEALGLFTRLLTIDPYDEQVHRRLVSSLVRAGRLGEAKRAFDRWCRAMDDIDAPLPDPDTVDPALTRLVRPRF